jgi:multiple sugar transport system substrate-binding protein
MTSELRDMLDEGLRKIRAGRMTRRTFLERAVTVGLSTSAAVSLLEACGGSSSTNHIVWTSESGLAALYQKYVDTFNKTNSDGIHVTYIEGQPGNLLRVIYNQMFRAHANTADIVSMDVTWPVEYAANGWLVPLDEQWPQSERVHYFPVSLKSGTYEGKIWAAPFSTAVGLLYYHTDLIAAAPTTWGQLTSLVKKTQPRFQDGYVWQGTEYEGLTCDFVEVLNGYGGSVLDQSNPKRVVVNSPEAVQALTEMVNWIGTISPSSVTVFNEGRSLQAFQADAAAFMRNWSDEIVPGNDQSQSKVVGKFAVSALPASASNMQGHGCLGGWHLGINAFSKSPDAAWTFLRYLLSAKVQKNQTLTQAGYATLQSIYEDPEVVAHVPFVSRLKSNFLTALLRPISPVYPDISTAIQQRVYRALKKQISPADALRALQVDLQTIVSKSV